MIDDLTTKYFSVNISKCKRFFVMEGFLHAIRRKKRRVRESVDSARQSAVVGAAISCVKPPLGNVMVA